MTTGPKDLQWLNLRTGRTFSGPAPTPKRNFPPVYPEEYAIEQDPLWWEATQLGRSIGPEQEAELTSQARRRDWPTAVSQATRVMRRASAVQRGGRALQAPGVRLVNAVLGNLEPYVNRPGYPGVTGAYNVLTETIRSQPGWRAERGYAGSLLEPRELGVQPADIPGTLDVYGQPAGYRESSEPPDVSGLERTQIWQEVQVNFDKGTVLTKMREEGTYRGTPGRVAATVAKYAGAHLAEEELFETIEGVMRGPEALTELQMRGKTIEEERRRGIRVPYRDPNTGRVRSRFVQGGLNPLVSPPVGADPAMYDWTDPESKFPPYNLAESRWIRENPFAEPAGEDELRVSRMAGRALARSHLSLEKLDVGSLIEAPQRIRGTGAEASWREGYTRMMTGRTPNRAPSERWGVSAPPQFYEAAKGMSGYFLDPLTSIEQTPKWASRRLWGAYSRGEYGHWGVETYVGRPKEFPMGGVGTAMGVQGALVGTGIIKPPTPPIVMTTPTSADVPFGEWLIMEGENKGKMWRPVNQQQFEYARAITAGFSGMPASRGYEEQKRLDEPSVVELNRLLKQGIERGHRGELVERMGVGAARVAGGQLHRMQTSAQMGLIGSGEVSPEEAARRWPGWSIRGGGEFVSGKGGTRYTGYRESPFSMLDPGSYWQGPKSPRGYMSGMSATAAIGGVGGNIPAGGRDPLEGVFENAPAAEEYWLEGHGKKPPSVGSPTATGPQAVMERLKRAREGQRQRPSSVTLEGVNAALINMIGSMMGGGEPVSSLHANLIRGGEQAIISASLEPNQETAALHHALWGSAKAGKFGIEEKVQGVMGNFPRFSAADAKRFAELSAMGGTAATELPRRMPGAASALTAGRLMKQYGPMFERQAALGEMIGAGQLRDEDVSGLRELYKANAEALRPLTENFQLMTPQAKLNVEALKGFNEKIKSASGAIELQAKILEDIAPGLTRMGLEPKEAKGLERELTAAYGRGETAGQLSRRVERRMARFERVEELGKARFPELEEAAAGGRRGGGGRGGIGQQMLYAPWWWQVAGQYGGEQYKQAIAYGMQAQAGQAQLAALQGELISAGYLQRLQTETGARSWRETLGIAAQKSRFAQFQSWQMGAMNQLVSNPEMAAFIGGAMPFGQPAFFGAAMTANMWAPALTGLGGGAVGAALGTIGTGAGFAAAGLAGAAGGVSLANILGPTFYGQDQWKQRGVPEGIREALFRAPEAMLGIAGTGTALLSRGAQGLGLEGLAQGLAGATGILGGAMEQARVFGGAGAGQPPTIGTLSVDTLELLGKFEVIPYQTTAGPDVFRPAPSQQAGMAAMWQQLAGNVPVEPGVTGAMGQIMTAWNVKPNEIDTMGQMIGQEMMEALGFRGVRVGSIEAATQIPGLMQEMGAGGPLGWAQSQLVRRYVGPEAQWAGVDPVMVEEYMKQSGIAAGSTLRPTFAIQRATQKMFGGTPYDYSDIMRQQKGAGGLAVTEEGGAPYGTTALRGIEDSQRKMQWEYQQANWKMEEEHLNFTIGKTKELWGIQDQMTKIDRENQGKSMDLQIDRSENELKWYWSNFELYKDQWQEKFDLDKRMFEAREEYWGEDFETQKTHREQEHEWAQQDFAYQKNMFEMRAGWQMEDFDRAIRFATGRQKEDLMREKERAVIISNMQRNQMAEQQKRDEVRWAWTQDQANKEQTRHEEMVALQREEFALRQTQFNEETALRQAQMEDQKVLAEAQLAFLKDQKADMETQYGLTDEQKELQRAMQQEQWDFQIKRTAEEVAYQSAAKLFQNDVLKWQRTREDNEIAYNILKVKGLEETKTLYEDQYNAIKGWIKETIGVQEQLTKETQDYAQAYVDSYIILSKISSQLSDMKTPLDWVPPDVHGTKQFGGPVNVTGLYRLEEGERVIPKGGDTISGDTYVIHIHGGDPTILVPLMDKIMARHGVSFRDRVRSE